MKSVLIAMISMTVAHSAFADPACSALSAAVGVYKQIKTSCSVGPEGADLASHKFFLIKPSQLVDWNGTFASYLMVVADPSDFNAPLTEWVGTGAGPSVSPTDIFKCVKSGNSITVNDPEVGTQYRIDGANLEILFGQGCQAQYSKIN